MPGKPNPRNHRNNPYVLDGFAVQVHHSTVGTLWRFRTELAVLLSGTAAELLLASAVTVIWSLIILAATIGLLFVLPWPRRFAGPPGLVRDHPAPAAEGVLRNPDAYPVRAAIPDPADPADQGR